MTHAEGPAPVCWCLTEGHAGMESQTIGLAEALGVAPIVQRVRLRFPWTHIPPRLALPPLNACKPGSDAPAPPWPDLLITCGRRSVGLSMRIRRNSAGRTVTVHIQDPLVPADSFDLIAVPEHDRLRGPNVMVTRAAIHRVTAEKMAASAARLAPTLAHLPRPLVAVLVGGSNRRYRLTPQRVTEICRDLAQAVRDTGAGLAVTPSRRTGAENESALRAGLAGLPAYIWDGEGENPYLGLLGLADAIVVTADSVSMVSEALATGKPVHVIECEGLSRRFDAFHTGLQAAGLTRPFRGRLEDWRYEPPDDTRIIAQEIARRLSARTQGGKGWPAPGPIGL
ncbi:MAG: mitochondrial fission ELM1 family protein [Proteobacteria bacterium]|nr:mitochondrial fission ELM1 family protein [Pseudomonadota bacterium]